MISWKALDKIKMHIKDDYTRSGRTSTVEVACQWRGRRITCGVVQACQAEAPVEPAAGTVVMPDTLPPSQVPLVLTRHCQVTSLLSAMVRTKRALRRENDSGALELLLIWVSGLEVNRLNWRASWTTKSAMKYNGFVMHPAHS